MFNQLNLYLQHVNFGTNFSICVAHCIEEAEGDDEEDDEGVQDGVDEEDEEGILEPYLLLTCLYSLLL